MRSFKPTPFILAVALAFSACGSEDDPPSIDAEGCEHLQEGPAVPVTATAAATGAPAISNDHQRYDVTLTDVAGGKGGAVSFAAAEATDYVFFLSAGVPVRFRSAAGAEVAPESSVASSSECAEIKARIVVPLTVGTYTLELGPTPETLVGIVVEEAEHAEE